MPTQTKVFTLWPFTERPCQPPALGSDMKCIGKQQQVQAGWGKHPVSDTHQGLISGSLQRRRVIKEDIRTEGAFKLVLEEWQRVSISDHLGKKIPNKGKSVQSKKALQIRQSNSITGRNYWEGRM